MPYVQLEHALSRYCAVTGVRAILADQGQNDWPERDEDKIFANYRAWIEQARKDAGFPRLAVVVNRQSPPDGFGQIRRVQDRVIREHPFCFPRRGLRHAGEGGHGRPRPPERIRRAQGRADVGRCADCRLLQGGRPRAAEVAGGRRVPA
jgi:hypothetical protein